MREGVANFHLWFLVRLSFYLGFYPGNEYTPGCWFDIAEGVFTPVMPAHRVMFEPDNSRILAALMEAEVSELDELKLSRTQRSGFMSAVLTYFGYHLDSINNVKSIQILRDVF